MDTRLLEIRMTSMGRDPHRVGRETPGHSNWAQERRQLRSDELMINTFYIRFFPSISRETPLS